MSTCLLPVECCEVDPLTRMDRHLFCLEREVQLKAYRDPMLLGDDRVLQSLLHTEDRYTISFSYFKCVQTEVKEYMRKIVAMWMLEVCEDQRCQGEVFPLAMNYVDRFLSIVEVRKSQLQLLGAVCLFLSSKLKETRPLTAELLCFFTENSITVEELQGWELLVLSKLKWDLSAITALDFLDHILQRLSPIKDNEMIRSHAHTFITLCSIDFKFSMYSPSMIACASIGAAASGLVLSDNRWSAKTELLHRLHDITAIDVDCLRACQEQIEAMVASSRSTNQSPSAAQSNPPQSLAVKGITGDCQDVHPKAETPTDVRDIHF